MLHGACGEITIMKSTAAPLIFPCVSSMIMRRADVSAARVEPERVGHRPASPGSGEGYEKLKHE